ncbi:hypothetical protein VTO73DRAFT_7704 [Trametes versicolor]
MPPPQLRRLLGHEHQARSGGAGPANTEPYFSAESSSWRSPDDILSILMIIGGDIVQRAVAQLAGSGPSHFAPVAFSFGWLAYSVSALTSAVGDGRLLPPPDITAQVVNAHSGYGRENASWVLSRLLRDSEKHAVKDSPLTIVFFRTRRNGSAGFPARDWVYWSGVLVILAQLAIAAIPGALNGNWIPLMVTAGGTVLALTASGLPQWREEKFRAARKVKEGSREVVCITRGNGSAFAMVVITDSGGIRLEDLAGGRFQRTVFTSIMSAVLCVLWVVLLLAVEGIQGDAWYLLAVGGLGMVQNVVAAGARRSAAALGFHFERTTKDDVVTDLTDKKVMSTLQSAEEREAGVGLALLPLYFPGDLRAEEKAYWEQRKAATNKAQVPKSLEARPPRTSEKKVPQTRADPAEKDIAESMPSVSFTDDASSSQTHPAASGHCGHVGQ